jgi:iron complex outermembrane receptor protein
MNYYLKNFVPGYGFINSVYSLSKEKSLHSKVEYIRNFKNSISLNASVEWNYHDVNTLDTVTSEGYESKRNAFSLFVAFRRRFFDHLNTNLMIRQGLIDGVLTPPAPFFGFDVMVSKKYQLIVKGNIAANYHQPSLNDMYWLPGGNPDLKPERGYSAELGAETILEYEDWSVIPDFTLFYSDIDDWIIWTYSGKGYWSPQNIKRVVTTGMESSVKITCKIREIEMNASGTYSYTRALNYGDVLVWGDESYGKQLVYIPVHSGNVMVGLEWKDWNMNYQHNSYSERFVTSSNDLSSRSSIYPYFMNDLKIGRKIAFQSFDISAELKINNLFNEEYHTVLMQPMPGINFMFQLMFDLK